MIHPGSGDRHLTEISLDGKVTSCSCGLPFVECKPCLGLIAHAREAREALGVDDKTLISRINKLYLLDSWKRQFPPEEADEFLEV